MFACSQCSKEFTSQGSLARHLQNHSLSARHTCNICSVIFRRRDLLTRHMRLHEPDPGHDHDRDQDPESDRQTSGADEDTVEATVLAVGAVSRKRCHTACNRCRDLKIKCDGQFPCGRCCRSKKSCYFDRPTSRISQVSTAVEARALSAGDDSAITTELPLPSFSPLAGLPDQELDHGPIDNGDVIIAVDGHDEFVEPSLPWDAMFTEVTPWPWLHENIFLSGDQSAFLDCNAVPGLPPPDDILTNLPLETIQNVTNQNGQRSGMRNDCPQDSHADNGDTADPVTLKKRLVDDLIALAVHGGSGVEGGGSSTKPSDLWARAPLDLASIFNLDPRPPLAGTGAALEHFVKLYTQHFHQLWPLIPRRHLDSGEVHPVLYLVLASIGAMYAGSAGSECGAFLHNAVRRRVVQPLELDDADDNLIWLGQARLLTQVAALYFGQPRAFSYAQHLGTLLTTQASRMYLFSAANHQQRVRRFKQMRGVAMDAECLDMWLAIEERRRLAFGIFRGDTFTSVLLNTKPLVTLDEIALEFPNCNAVFNGVGLDPRFALEMIEHDQTPSRDLRASDVYHILLERNELLPPLEPVAHEILLFGLQLLVWRFSRDRQLLEGLTLGRGVDELPHLDHAVADQQNDPSDPPPYKRRRRDTFTSEVDSLDNASYQMADLATERQRLVSALEKWERALPLAKTFARTEADRSYVLSSLILYHLSLLRLYAPVEDIHQIHYRLADRRPVSQGLIDGIRSWTLSPEARSAMQRVRSVWSLITQESRRGRARSRFNFNAYVGLHHSAAILWAYHGALDRSQAADQRSISTSSGGQGPVLQRDDASPTFSVNADLAESMETLKTFVELFHSISPARWSSFAEVTNTLTGLEFPTSGDR